MMEIPDRLLLDRYIALRDEAAFRTLVERHLPLVHGVAWRTLGGREDLARDAVQETFIRLAKRAALVPPQVDLGAWLHRIARHAAVDLIRSEARRKKRELLAATSPDITAMTSSHDPASEEPAWDALAPVVDALVDSLPTADRDLVVARFYRNESHAAIAGRLGVSETLIRKRSSRALEKLRALLGRKGIATTSAALAALLPAHAATTPASFPALMTAVAGAVRGVVSLVPSGFTSLRLAMNTAQKSSLAAAAVIFLASAGYSLRPANENTAVSSETSPTAGNVAATAEGRVRRERKLPSTPEERFERLRQIVALPGGLRRKRELMEFIDLLSPSQYQETAENLQKLKPEPGLGEMGLVMGAWTKVEPQAATEWSMRPGNPGGALWIWGELDPEAALAWTIEHFPENALKEVSWQDPRQGNVTIVNRPIVLAVLQGWAVRDPRAALKALKNLFPEEAARTKAMTALSSFMANQPDGLQRLGAAMPESQERSQMVGENSYAMAKNQPERGLEMLLADPGAGTAENVSNFFATWSGDDRAAALARVARLPPGEMQDAAVQGVCRGTGYRQSEQSLALLRQYPSAATDDTILEVAHDSIVEDLFGGLENYLLVRDPARRDVEFVKMVGPLMTQCPDQMQQWLDTHEVPESTRKALKESLSDVSR